MVTAGYRPSEQELSHLVALRQMPGFQVLLNIFESQVAQAQLDMMNADETDEKAIVAKQRIAKAAAVFYQRSIDRVNEELMTFGARRDESKIQPDLTEHLFQ